MEYQKQLLKRLLQMIEDNEKEIIDEIFSNCTYHTFADYLSDEEMSTIDKESFESLSIEYEKYLSNIKKKKNALIVNKILSIYNTSNRFIFADDLGIDLIEEDE